MGLSALPGSPEKEARTGSKEVPSMTHAKLVPLSLLVLLACSDRSLANAAGETSGNDSYPGEVYASCEDAADCDSELSCFHPAGETGYCASSCIADDQCQGLSPSHGDIDCVNLQPSNANVCAIRCEHASCPLNMRCEAVDLGGQEARLCF
jgi:hypothetical protein